jgi:ATP-dependent RNA helicase DeaD
LLFSATIPKEIKEIAKKYQKNPKFIKVSDKKQNIPKITQYSFKCDIKDKFRDMTILLDAYNVNLALIFCNTKKSVDFVKKHLKKEGYSVDSIHGDMTQKARDKVMNKFRNGNISILVATDVAARGLDIDNVDVVINYDVPQNPDDYVHRIGRTARAGKTGLAFTLVVNDEMNRFNNIQKANKTKIISKKIPTRDELDEIRAKQVLKGLDKVIKNENLDKYKKIIEKNSNSKDGCLEIAAALLKKRVEN